MGIGAGRWEGSNKGMLEEATHRFLRLVLTALYAVREGFGKLRSCPLIQTNGSIFSILVCPFSPD